jgi:DNA invertase Pin-like site-specific DNA recombinase
MSADKVVKMLRDGRITVREAAPALGIHRSNVYKLCRREGIDPADARMKFLRRAMQKVAIAYCVGDLAVAVNENAP